MKKATCSSMANFLKENIICCFGVPNRIISDNGTPFLNKDVPHLIEWYSISHMTLIPYYPNGNGQAKASNKRLLKILGKMTKENGKGWKEMLPTALWAYRTAKSQYKSFTLFFSLWHRGCYPNRISKANSEASRDCRDSQRRPFGSCGSNA